VRPALRSLAARAFERVAGTAEDLRKEEIRRRYGLPADFGIGDATHIYGPGRVESGPGSYIGAYGMVLAAEGRLVRIGANTAISHFVAIYTENRDPRADLSKGKALVSGDVVVGDHCWIGIGALLLQGTTIGDHAVVGAHSVVHGRVPERAIVAGAPLRYVGWKAPSEGGRS